MLQAAVECFYELGYANTTTDNIANRAGVSRGAMLHHFPSRHELIHATIIFLNQQRIEAFAEEEAAVQQGAEHSRIDEGIDTYWRQLNSPIFVVFHELTIAARTDPQLAKMLQPAFAEFNTKWMEALRQVFPDLAQSNEFERTIFMTEFMLESMAVMKQSGLGRVPEQMMLDWLKNELHTTYADVLKHLKRPADGG